MGENILVAWNLVEIGRSKNEAQTFFAILNNQGNVLSEPIEVDTRFTMGDDFFNFANGDAGWVRGHGDTLKVYRYALQ